MSQIMCFEPPKIKTQQRRTLKKSINMIIDDPPQHSQIPCPDCPTFMCVRLLGCCFSVNLKSQVCQCSLSAACLTFAQKLTQSQFKPVTSLTPGTEICSQPKLISHNDTNGFFPVEVCPLSCPSGVFGSSHFEPRPKKCLDCMLTESHTKLGLIQNCLLWKNLMDSDANLEVPHDM